MAMYRELHRNDLSMAQFHDAASRYLAVMREALPLYDRLQDEIVRATAGVRVSKMLDLGAGTGETSRRCLAAHPDAGVVVLDSSEEMLKIAAEELGTRAALRSGRLEDPLPDGSFDLVVSALAVHHLDGDGKANLFRRLRGCLRPGGKFVMGDVVVPEAPVSVPTLLDPSVDRPDRLGLLLLWLRQASFEPEVCWADQDLVVIAAS
jgi:tRNA (cmo5U34)-methyltransferase